MRRVIAALALSVLAILICPSPATARPVAAIDLDCKESPTPDMPGQGLASFFAPKPGSLPPNEDPFKDGSTSSIYEQYGFAGLRWNTYDLGCGPDAARSPDAVIGTAVSDWMMNIPVALSSLTASITQVSFHPTFLGVFDPMLTRVSTALHDNLFLQWVPGVIALLGLVLLVKARGLALASTAGAVAWAITVLVITAALFRWPVAAGHFADDTVSASLGSVIDGLNGGKTIDPATAVASNVQESILYRAWLSGELGSTDSETAKKYGPELFKAQTLSWREAQIVQSDPDAGKALIAAKRDRFGQLADLIKDQDPTAYEHLTGKRSDTRVGYALLATLATILALPFLLVSSLMLLGSFLIVRLAVMLFPAFATLGVFPTARGAVIGIGRTVGAALINSVIFGIGAAVTVTILGVILDPGTHVAPWLTLVLLPLVSLIMWLTLKPFRRLTSMAGLSSNAFGEGTSFGHGGRGARRLLKNAIVTAAASYTGNVAAAATVAAHEQKESGPPDRAEARPNPIVPTGPSTPSLPALEARPAGAGSPSAPGETHLPPPRTPLGPSPTSPASGPLAVEEFVPRPTSESAPLPPIEPEWHDGEEIYPIYRPADDPAHDAA
jgi:hypothetical protein